MKKRIVLIPLSILFVLIILSSCSVDPIGEKRSIFAYGTLEIKRGRYCLIDDDGYQIILANNTQPDSKLGKRFFVTGLASKPNKDTWELNVQLMEEVRLKQLSIMDSSINLNNFGTDGVFIENNLPYLPISFSGKYLNFIHSIRSTDRQNNEFSYIYNEKTVELVKNRVTIYIRQKDHNLESGNAKKLQYVYTSLDMTPVFNKINDDIISIVLDYIDLQGHSKKEIFEIKRK